MENYSLQVAVRDANGVKPGRLRAEGFTHYIAMPMDFANGALNVMAISTRHTDGFSAEMMEVIRILLPALTAAVELRALDEIMREVLAIYVGAEPAKQLRLRC